MRVEQAVADYWECKHASTVIQGEDAQEIRKLSEEVRQLKEINAKQYNDIWQKDTDMRQAKKELSDLKTYRDQEMDKLKRELEWAKSLPREQHHMIPKLSLSEPSDNDRIKGEELIKELLSIMNAENCCMDIRSQIIQFGVVPSYGDIQNVGALVREDLEHHARDFASDVSKLRGDPRIIPPNETIASYDMDPTYLSSFIEKAEASLLKPRKKPKVEDENDTNSPRSRARDLRRSDVRRREDSADSMITGIIFILDLWLLPWL